MGANMIKKGMKEGAVFTEDGSFYKVEEVLPDGNYISRRISEDEAEKLGGGKAGEEAASGVEAENKKPPCVPPGRTPGRKSATKKTGQQKAR
mgnify:CR=1 FL=1